MGIAPMIVRAARKLAMVAAAVFCLLMAGGTAKAECPPDDWMTYQLANAPKALAASENEERCFAHSAAADAAITDVINSSLARCEATTGQPCRIVTFNAVSAGTPLVNGSEVAALKAELSETRARLNEEIAKAGGMQPVPSKAPACRIGRIPYDLGGEPVQVNPDGACGITVWNRHCIFVRQAGETNTLGPYCPPGERSKLPGTRYGGQLPADLEWIWSAAEPFTAYVQLVSQDSAVDPKQFVGSDAWRALCATKYKTFEWYTGLYTAKNGRRLVCEVP
jgi:hypothetical protein